MKKFAIFALFTALMTVFSGCASSGRTDKQSYAMDSVIVMSAFGEDADVALSLCDNEISRIAANLSLSGENSEIAAINAANGAPVTVSDETKTLISRAVSFSENTMGAFDITMLPVTREWGFNDGVYLIPSEEKLSAAAEKIGYEKIRLEKNTVTLPEGAGLDMDKMLHGYACDKSAEILRSFDVTSAKISFGRVSLLLGSMPDGEDWSVPVHTPHASPDEPLLRLLLSSSCVSTAERSDFFEINGKTYFNIIDPATCRPAENGILSVTVIASGAADAEILSEALFILGETSAIDYWETYGGFDMIIVTDDFRIVFTPGLSGKISFEYYDEFPYSFFVIDDE